MTIKEDEEPKRITRYDEELMEEISQEIYLVCAKYMKQDPMSTAEALLSVATRAYMVTYHPDNAAMIFYQIADQFATLSIAS